MDTQTCTPGPRMPLWAWIAVGGPMAFYTILGIAEGESYYRIPVRFLGIASLVFLVLGLAITPAAKLLARPGLTPWRRWLGLWAFAYAVAHTVVYAFNVHIWHWSLPRYWRYPYLVYGIIALLLAIPLAVTSNAASMRKLGFTAWKRLHLLTYPVIVLTLIHYTLPLYRWNLVAYYWAVTALLVGWRLVQGLSRPSGRLAKSWSRRAPAFERTE